MSERFLYRYQPYKVDWVDKLTSSDIWVSDPMLFNDSTDLKPKINDKTYLGPFSSSEHFIAAVEHVFKENPAVNGYWLFGSTDDEKSPASILRDPRNHLDFEKYFGESLLKRIQGFGVTCFVSAPDMQVMWAHYANSSHGYCLKYKADCNFKAENENSNKGLVLMDVDYSTLFKHEYCISEIIFSPHRSLHRLLATKHIDWSYEKETRLICFDKKNSHIDIPSWLQLTGIILGPNADKKTKDHLEAKAKELAIEFAPAHHIKK